MKMLSSVSRVSFFSILLLLGASPVWADDAAISKELGSRGVKFTDANGTITGIDVPDPSRLNGDDYQKIAELAHLQKLSFGRGFNNTQLSTLIHLAGVTTFGTNGSDLDDAGVAQLAHFKKLQTLTFFHPGKNFKGTGLAELATLPNLESLTVGGTYSFGNEGMAAIAKLQHLKGLRVGHIDADSQGVALLKGLPGLTSVMVGQKLSFKPPAMLTNDTIGVLVSMKSLESVFLSESRLNLDALSQLKDLPALKRLTLDAIEIPEADVEKLRKILPNAQIKWTAPSPNNLKRINALLGEQ